MSKDDIQKAINRLPRLTDIGVSYNNRRKLTLEEYKSKFSKDQEMLLNSTETFSGVCKWLEGIKKIKTINRNHTSYGLKHVVEKDIGYVSNGVFIAAAIHCGFNFKHDEIPNVTFNMSEKSIKEKDRVKEPFLAL